jgi:hypothetical protein
MSRGGETGVWMGIGHGLEQCRVFGRDIRWHQELAEAGEEGGREAATVEDEVAEEDGEVRGLVLLVQERIHGVGGETVGEASAHPCYSR